MPRELSLNASLSFLKSGANLATLAPNTQFNVAGTAGIKNYITVGTSDESLDLGDVGTLGFVFVRNLEAVVIITTPDAPVVVPQGTPGAATWTYKIVAKQADGAYTAASAGGTTTTGNATLDATNFNRLTWTAISGASSYDVYRTAHGTTPSTNGLIATVTTTTYDDIGGAGDSASAPSTAIVYECEFGADGTNYPIHFFGGEFGFFRWNAAALHAKALAAPVRIEYTLIPL